MLPVLQYWCNRNLYYMTSVRRLAFINCSRILHIGPMTAANKVIYVQNNKKYFSCGYLFLLQVVRAKYPLPLYMAIVSSDNSGVQISTTKNSLHGDSVLICSATKKPCSVYQSDDFSIAKPNDSVEDIATGGNIYTYSIFGSKSYKLQSEITVAFIFKTGSIGANNVEFDGKHSFCNQKR
ncbi:Uncharacterised protein [Raoultella terrigena]|nr:Uncharacterised protein [Raoultella terrigena]